MIGNLLDNGLLHDDVKTIAGDGMSLYRQEPELQGGEIVYRDGPAKSHNEKILRPASDPFAQTGGLVQLAGNLGTGVMKSSAVKEEHHIVEAPARVRRACSTPKTP